MDSFNPLTVTFGKYKLKNVTKDVMSYLGCPFKEANSITKDIPDNSLAVGVPAKVIREIENDLK